MRRPAISWWKILIWVAVVAATLGFLYAVRGILLPFVLAFVISVLLDPTIQKLRRRGWSRGFSVGFVMVVFFSLVGLLGVLTVPMISRQLSGFSGNLQNLTQQLGSGANTTLYTNWNPVTRAVPAKANPVDQILTTFESPLSRFGFPTTRRALVQQYVEPHRDNIAKSITNFFNGFFNILLNAGSKALMLLFTPIFVFLMLSDFERLKVRSATWIPTSIRAETISLVREVGQVFINYLRGVTTSVMIYTGICAILFSILGVPYPILLALIAGGVYMVPYLGYLITALIVFAATGFSGETGNFMMNFADSWTFATVVTVVYTIIFFAYDNFVNPKFLGSAVGLNQLVSMFTVFSGGALFGIVGMIIAFPVAGSVKVILERIIRTTSSGAPDHLSLPVTPLRHRTAAEI